MTQNNQPIDKDDSRQYLMMLQDIINRMANNSTNCKVWVVALVTAIMAIKVAESNWDTFIYAPIVVFYLLDSYYLGLEKGFRHLQAKYVQVLKSNSECSDKIYDFNLRESKCKFFFMALLSLSTWPIYLILVLLVWALK